MNQGLAKYTNLCFHLIKSNGFAQFKYPNLENVKKTLFEFVDYDKDLTTLTIRKCIPTLNKIFA